MLISHSDGDGDCITYVILPDSRPPSTEPGQQTPPKFCQVS